MTVRRYLDVLTATFVVRQLRPWSENLTKLKRLDVIHAGHHIFPLSRGVRAVALKRLLDDPAPLA